MKLKKILKYTALALAATALLTGCEDGKNSDPNSNNSPGDSISRPGQSDSDNSGDITDEELGITSSKPREISGFLGNTVTVVPKAGDLIATFEIEGHGTIKAVLFPEAAPVGVENFQKLCDQGFYKGLTIHRVMDQFMFQGGSTNGNGTGGDAAVNDGSFGIETAQNARHFYGALCYANAAGSNSTQFYIVNNDQEQDLSLLNKEAYEAIIEEGKSYIKEAIRTNQPDYVVQYYRSQTQNYQNTIDWFTNATDEIKKLYKERGGTPSLDGSYTVFGQVYDGFDVISSISRVEVKNNGSGEKSSPVQKIVIKDITVSVFE